MARAVTIRQERQTDIAAVHAVHEAAFPTRLEANLVDALRGGGKALVSLVADDAGLIVGHILFSPVAVVCDSRTVEGVGLAPVAVLPDRQRRGIGSALIRGGLDACRGNNFSFVVVLGEPRYYRRFGFVRAADRVLGNEYGADEEFMVIELRPGGLPPEGGLAKYAPEFAAAGS